MNKINNILVIVDPAAETHPAIEKAARIARSCSARLELFACETKESRSMRHAAHLRKGEGEFVENVCVVIDRIAEPLRDAGLDVCVDTAIGDPLVVQLLNRVRKTCADLVVKDTHHHSLAKRTFLTNTDWHLIRSCPVPLLLTKDRAWGATPALAAAVDPLHVNDKPQTLDNRILDWATALRDKMSGTLRLVHAYMPLVVAAEAVAGMPPMVSALSPQMLEEERQRSLQSIASLAAPYGINLADIAAQLGVASEVLPRFAEDSGIDIMLMGAISRSGLKRVFIGSTAERVLEQLPCDALVIKPLDFASELPF